MILMGVPDVRHMSNDEFQIIAQPGDHLTIYKSHSKDAPVQHTNVEFLGYTECSTQLSCRSTCKGYVMMNVPGFGRMSQCLRSDVNIRVKLHKSIHLDEELFEI